MKISEKNTITIILVSVVIASSDNIAVALATTIPFITNRLYHGLFIGFILALVGTIGLIITSKKNKASFNKVMVLIPIGIFGFGFLFDYFILNFFKGITYVVPTGDIFTENLLTISMSFAILFFVVLGMLFFIEWKGKK